MPPRSFNCSAMLTSNIFASPVHGSYTIPCTRGCWKISFDLCNVNVIISIRKSRRYVKSGLNADKAIMLPVVICCGLESLRLYTSSLYHRRLHHIHTLAMKFEKLSQVNIQASFLNRRLRGTAKELTCSMTLSSTSLR